MKRLGLLIFCWLMLGLTAQAQVTRVAGTWGQCTTCTVNAGSTANTSAGNQIIVTAAYPNARAVLTIADTAIDVFDVSTACSASNVACRALHYDQGGYYHDVYCLPSSAGNGANVITVTLDGSADYFTVMSSSYSGATCKPDTGSVPSCTGTGNSAELACSAALNTAAAGSLLIAEGGADFYTIGGKAPWADTSGAVNTGDGAAYLVGSGGAENNAIFTAAGSGTWKVTGYAFLPTGGAPPTKRRVVISD